MPYTGKIIRIGRVELTVEDAERLYSENKYIITYSKIYKLIRKKNGDVGGKELIYYPGMMRRGRFYAWPENLALEYIEEIKEAKRRELCH